MWQSCIVGFQGAWLHFRRAKSVSVFSAAVCKIQASKRYNESLPSVLKNKNDLFLSRWKVRCTAASWSYVCPLEVECLIDIWKASIYLEIVPLCILIGSLCAKCCINGWISVKISQGSRVLRILCRYVGVNPKCEWTYEESRTLLTEF